ncbi:hypothetical protein GIB67_008217 [Kingdonia uniflora]|uniref:Dirigent protein n=1 Tax=Kingdonia uniflora TaxID=39325 RepID=A0A7J7N598_9MAGN|nr:hypothetical protein GIB67_008217 [Kingdonia uniflora]
MPRFTTEECFTILILLYATQPVLAHKKHLERHTHKPCKRIVLYYHDTLFDGTNMSNATSAIIANATQLGKFSFREFIVFDDPMTKNQLLMSPPVARAQDMMDEKTRYFSGGRHRRLLYGQRDRDIPNRSISGGQVFSRKDGYQAIRMLLEQTGQSDVSPCFLIIFWLIWFIVSKSLKPYKVRQPCQSLVFYFHDIIYNGMNAKNATSAIIASPEGANKTILAGQNHFGNLVVFDDPITLDNNLHSKPVGRAQGLYVYDKKEIFTAWLAFSLVLNSTDYKGTINFAGADPLMNKTRDVSVVGGTGDFFMTRGVATLMTDAFEGEVYFRLRVEINLYECW